MQIQTQFPHLSPPKRLARECFGLFEPAAAAVPSNLFNLSAGLIVLLLLLACGLFQARAQSPTPIMAFRADDPAIVMNSDGTVALWPDESGFHNDATAGGATGAVPAPTVATAVINGVARPVIRFDGTQVLQAPVMQTPVGSFFIVMKTSNPNVGNQRVVGWGDSDVGQNGLELSPQLNGSLYAILRDYGAGGDMHDPGKPNVDYEVITVTWGAAGCFLYRNGVAASDNDAITSISSDPGITSLTIGGPGSGHNGQLYRGDILEIQVYDQQLTNSVRSAVETAMIVRWLIPPSPAIVSTTPSSGSTVPANALISVAIANGLTSAVVPATVQLLVNQQAVSPTITNQVSGLMSITTVSYQPVANLPAGTNSFKIIFGDNETPPVFQTNVVSFLVNDILASSRLLTVTPPMLSGSTNLPFAAPGIWLNPAPYGFANNTNSLGWSWNNGQNLVVNFHSPVIVTRLRAYVTDPVDAASATWLIAYSSDGTNWTTAATFNLQTTAGGGVNDDGTSRSDLAGWYQTVFNVNGTISAQYWQVTQTAAGGLAPTVGPVRFYGIETTAMPIMAFRADDPAIVTNSDGTVALWPDESGFHNDATAGGATGAVPRPTAATAVINGEARPVIRFDGTQVLQAPVMQTPLGSFFIVMKTSDSSIGNQRVVGWGDSNTGHNGLELSPQLAGGLYAILRNDGAGGDINVGKPNVDYEVITLTWGAAGCFLYRNGVQVGTNHNITSISSDPTILGLTIGGPGSGVNGQLYQGDILEIQAYDQQLSNSARSGVELAMFDRWVAPLGPAIISTSPSSGSTVAGNATISVTIVNGQTAVVAPATVQLLVNQQAVSPTIINQLVGVENITTVSYQPAANLPAGTNSFEIIFGDNETPPVFQTNVVSFLVNNLLAASQQITVTPPMLSGSTDLPFAAPGIWLNPAPYGFANNTNSLGWSWNNGQNLVVNFHSPVIVTRLRAYVTDPVDAASATWLIAYSSDGTNWTTAAIFNLQTTAGGGVNDNGTSRSDLAGWYQTIFNVTGNGVSAQYWRVTQTAAGSVAPIVGEVQFYGIETGATMPVMAFRADDPGIVTNSDGTVALWPDESGFHNDATAGGATGAVPGPTAASVTIDGAARPVIRFNGTQVLQAPVMQTPVGSFFIVMKTSHPNVGNQRVVGWGDSDVGQNGLELSPQLNDSLYAILRDYGAGGDMQDPGKPNVDYEVITVTWGAAGCFLYRNGVQVGANHNITSISSDPTITALTIGGPGSGNDKLYQGDILEIQAYDRQLANSAVLAVESAMFDRWLAGPNAGRLSLVRVANGVVLSWTGTGILQSAAAITGPWNDVVGATNPQTVSTSAAQKFYRLRQ